MKEKIQKLLFGKKLDIQADFDYLSKQEEIKALVNTIRPNETADAVTEYDCNVLICLINPEIDFRAKITDIVSALSNKFIITAMSGNIIVALTNNELIANSENLFSDTKTIILRRKIQKSLIEARVPINQCLFSFSEELLLDFKKMNYGDFICQVQEKEITVVRKNLPKDLWWNSNSYETCPYLIFIGFVNPEIFTKEKASEITKSLCNQNFIVSNIGFIGNIVTAYKKISDSNISELKIEGVKSLLLAKNTTVELLGDGMLLPFVPIYSFTDELIDKLLAVDYGNYSVISE